MRHLPRGLVSAQPEFILQLDRRDAVAAGGHEFHGKQPLMQGNMAAGKDSPGGERELLTARPALMKARAEACGFYGAAVRAHGTFGPAKLFKENPGRFFVLEDAGEGHSAAEVIGVLFGEVGPFFGQIIQRKNSRDRAHRHAGSAVDTLYRVDVEHLRIGEPALILFRMDTVNGAGVDAR